MTHVNNSSKDKISVVINTLNEEENIKRVLASVKWADEVLVCDMESDDKTIEVAEKMGARVITHKRLSFVEPARNFAISKARYEWILILDPDEEIPETLASRLKELLRRPIVSDYVKIPRKNIIFGKWMKASMWWPDLNIRFFRKGKVKWTDKIHRPPQTLGQGIDLLPEEGLAIIHKHYESIPQYLERMIRYTDIQSQELKKEGYIFDWKDLIKKPLEEFLGRFFANKGFEDGIHGFALSLLQAFSFLVVYLRIWEMEKFVDKDVNLSELKQLSQGGGKEIDYWFKYGNLSRNLFKRFFQKVGNKL